MLSSLILHAVYGYRIKVLSDSYSSVTVCKNVMPIFITITLTLCKHLLKPNLVQGFTYTHALYPQTIFKNIVLLFAG